MLKSRHACFGCYCVLLAFALMNHNSLVSPVAAFSSLTTNKNRHHNNNYRGFTMRPQATDGPTITIRANLRQASSKDDNAQESNNKVLTPQPALARGGLVQFPCLQPLGNTYYFLRVGESLLEAQDIWSTNPLFLTNEEAALSVKGVDQIRQACQTLRDANVIPSVVRYSFARACLDTSAILGDELQITQDRLIPEFFFLDPRAIGQWDKLPLSTTQPAVWALDVDEGQYDGRGGRPPANIDSTPHETLADHAIRLRQLFSACETQYSGDTVVLVFPDGSGPALLSCMIAGIPFDRVHELDLGPGELRSNVTRDTTLQLLEQKQQSQETYTTIIAQGRKELVRLRSIDFIAERDKAAQKALQEEQQKQQQKQQEERQHQEQRKMLAATPSTKGDLITPPPVLGSILGLVGAAGVVLAVTTTGEEKPELDSVVEEGGKNLPSVRDTPSTNNNVRSTSASTTDALATTMQAERTLTTTNSDTDVSVGSAEEELPTGDVKGERIALAQQAMEQYMDEDDGGSAWLQSLSDIISSEEVKEVKPFKKE